MALEGGVPGKEVRRPLFEGVNSSQLPFGLEVAPTPGNAVQAATFKRLNLRRGAGGAGALSGVNVMTPGMAAAIRITESSFGGGGGSQRSAFLLFVD